MGLVEIFLIALGLAMDACAASICKGLAFGAGGDGASELASRAEENAETKTSADACGAGEACGAGSVGSVGDAQDAGKAHGGRLREALLLASLFGAFQALMPLAGYALGSSFAAYVAPIDHWIAFILLGIIGGKMVIDALRESAPDEGSKESSAPVQKVSIAEALGLAVATSIDAFVVGCSFAFVQVDIAQAVIIIGLVTFTLSLLGFLLGRRLGTRFNKIATIVGGVVLILIGAKILFEHLEIL